MWNNSFIVRISEKNHRPGGLGITALFDNPPESALINLNL